MAVKPDMRKIMRKKLFVFLSIWIIFCWIPNLEAHADYAKQDQGFSSFANNLETVRETLKIPGMSVAVVQDQEVIFAQGFGYADLENQILATPDTPYGLASVTKPVAAVLMMQLVEEGLVDLDTPIADYGVNLLGDEITVRHLLTHTSEGVPGTQHEYNGSRYGTLSGMIESVTGKTFAENLSERFLLPLDMQSTALNPINYWGGSNPTGLKDLQPALGWGANFRHYPEVYAELAKPYQFDENYNLIPGMYQLYHNAAAGMISSVNDLAKFDIALDQGLLLGEAAKSEMHAPAVSTYKNRSDLMYGLGWYVQEFEDLQLLWHTGRWSPSTSALYLKVPAENLTYIVLANTDNLTTPFNGIGHGDISKSLLALTFFRHFVFPEKLGSEIPMIDWSNTEGPIVKQLAVVEDPAVKEFLERELWAYRQAYASVGQKGEVNKLWRVDQRAFPTSTMRNDELATQTVGQFPIVPQSLSITAFAKLSWGILIWLALVCVSIIAMLVTLVRSADMPKFQWIYWLLSALLLGPVSILVCAITRSPREGSTPEKWQSALIGSAFSVSVYALGWAVALTLLPYFGQNPPPIAILSTTYLIPLLMSWAFLRIPSVFSRRQDHLVKRLFSSFGAELIPMSVAYAVLFPLTMILDRWLTTIPGSLNPFYWAMLSLISVINLLAQFPIQYWMLHRGRTKRRPSLSKSQSSVTPVQTPRLLAVDALRGLIIVFMALDHANYFIAQQHSSGEYWGGAYPVYDSIAPFLTRFFTHFSAPGFFFLMGVGMTLFTLSRQKRGWSRGEIIRHFLLRGALLIALQLLVVNRAWELASGGWEIEWYFGVLYAIGGAMIICSALLWLKPRYLVGISLFLLIGTEILVPDPQAWGQSFPLIQNLFFFAGGNFPAVWVNYPILAWLELAVFGLAFGQWLAQDREKTFRLAVMMGLVSLAAFIVLRGLDGFGNLRPISDDGWMNFLNPVKYPPSITFTLLTIGVNLLLLRLFAWIEEWRASLLQPLVVFGSTPLFFYILHLFLYAIIGRILTPQGVSIALMLPFWILGLLALYPLCKWYAGIKVKQPDQSVLRFI
jgi:CubicO group peptidase (beta-lactamase class C family)/uncharacterized membrane protein